MAQTGYLKGLIVTAVIATALSTNGAFAAGERACESMTLRGPGDQRTVQFVDLDDDGRLSAGDRRIGQRAIFNEAGNLVAQRVWTITVLTVDDSGKATSTIAENMTVFDDGVIFATFLNRMPHDTADGGVTHFPSAGTEHTVLGGTGAFEGAMGTIRTVQEGNDFTYVVSLQCG